MNVETITGPNLSTLLPETVSGGCRLEDFWELSVEDRSNVLEQAIFKVHAWHFTRNRAYRHTLEARGVGGTITSSDLPNILRPTAQTFKSYIDILGTPFPQESDYGVALAGSQVHGPLQGDVSFGDHIKIFAEIPLRENIFPRFIISHLTEAEDVFDVGFFKTTEEFAPFQDFLNFIAIHFHLL